MVQRLMQLRLNFQHFFSFRGEIASLGGKNLFKNGLATTTCAGNDVTKSIRF